MKLRSVCLLVLPLALAAAPAVAAPRQDGTPSPTQEGEEPGGRGEIKVRTDMERLYHAYGFAHGGRSNINSIRVLSFRWIPHQVLEDGSERELEPMEVTVQLGQRDERMMRVDESIDGQERTKLVNDLQNNVRLWIDGEERQIAEILGEAQREAKLVFMLLDLLYRPEASDLKGAFEGLKKRDGQEYLAAFYEFHDSRALPETFRLFYHRQTGLVERIDIHDKTTPDNRRLSTFHISEYAPVDAEEPALSIKFPGRALWKERSGTTLALWRFTDWEVNPEVLPGWFAGG